MKKEVLIAIIIGFGLGLVITFGIWSANRNVTEREISTASGQPVTPLPTRPVESPDHNLFLTLDNPVNELLTNGETLTVSGETLTGLPVVILTDRSEVVTQADTAGNFSTEIDLTAGVNYLTVIAVTEQGEEVKKEVSVVYSTAEI